MFRISNFPFLCVTKEIGNMYMQAMSVLRQSQKKMDKDLVDAFATLKEIKACMTVKQIYRLS